MTIREAQQQLIAKLIPMYEDREASSIADLVMTKITDFNRIDRLLNKDKQLTSAQTSTLENYAKDLQRSKPVQYVLEEAWFAGLAFFVNEHVLIPRPETDELVHWVMDDLSGASIDDKKILDIGTGSGCISIVLKKRFAKLGVYCCDLSSQAIEVARKNARIHQTDIVTNQMDFLDREVWNAQPVYDYLISNPPYIPNRDKGEMHPNVLDHEPHLALFVPDQDPLIFYRAIAEFAILHLSKGGSLYVESHEGLAADVMKLFSFSGFSGITMKKDLQGKDRMIKATMLP